MTTRRIFLIATAGALLLPGSAFAQRGRARYIGGDDKPALVPGEPEHVDCGHGLVIPLTNDALQALWEGDDRYVTFGRAVSSIDVRARGHAQFTAEAMMKLMLLTLAFAPERLVRFDACGWRTRSGRREDMVMGTVDLPGRPFSPTSDEFGAETPAPPPTADEGADAPAAVQHALCVYVVLKAEAGLDYVRQHASLVCPQDVATPPPAQDNPGAMEAARQVCPAPTGLDRNGRSLTPG